MPVYDDDEVQVYFPDPAVELLAQKECDFNELQIRVSVTFGVSQYKTKDMQLSTKRILGITKRNWLSCKMTTPTRSLIFVSPCKKRLTD